MQPGEDEIVVTPASLITHAGHVEAIATEVDLARAAAIQVRLDGGAYGMVCAFVPVYLNGLSDGLMTGLDAAITSLRDTGARLRATAARFSTTDATAATDLHEAGQ